VAPYTTEVGGRCQRAAPRVSAARGVLNERWPVEVPDLQRRHGTSQVRKRGRQNYTATCHGNSLKRIGFEHTNPRPHQRDRVSTSAPRQGSRAWDLLLHPTTFRTPIMQRCVPLTIGEIGRTGTRAIDLVRGQGGAAAADHGNGSGCLAGKRVGALYAAHLRRDNRCHANGDMDTTVHMSLDLEGLARTQAGTRDP